MHFSISHSAGLVLLAIADVPVGVDVQQVPSLDVVVEAQSELHPVEAAELAGLPSEDRPTAFARAWARKESYLKGIGTGLSRSPTLDYMGTGTVPALGPEGWTIGDVEVLPGYAAAVSVKRASVQ